MSSKAAQLSIALKEAEIDALILTKQANQRYLEGFTGGDCYMLVSGGAAHLVADSRYAEMGERECRTAKIHRFKSPRPSYGEVIAKVARENGFFRLGFEKNHMTWGQHEEIEKWTTPEGIELVPASNPVEKIRAYKTPAEAAFCAEACRIADKALRDLLPRIKPGVSELALATELDYLMKKGGADEPSFDTMVLFGARSSQPHAKPRADARLEPGDFILIDYGACKSGYRSDTTRTFVCGKASDRQKHAYQTVLLAQTSGLAKVAPGVNARELCQISLDILADAGLPGFEYSIGHGVGLEIHEEPFMRRGKDVILGPGMILTIEPGTYIPGWGGVRIEDTVLVTEDGSRVLTFFPKELMEI